MTSTYNKKFNTMINDIIHDKDIGEFISYLSQNQIYEISNYLNNQLYYPLLELTNKITSLMPSKTETNASQIITKLICYHKQTNENKIKIDTVLFAAQKKFTEEMNSLTGGKGTDKIIIMKGISTTIRSIIDRPIDKEKIDHNLRKGANERKEYGQYHNNVKYISKKLPKEIFSPEFAAPIPTAIELPQNITSEVSVHPETSGSHTIEQYHGVKKLPAESTVRDYQQGVNILKELDPVDPFDKQLSLPLDEPPVGRYGSTIITPSPSITPESNSSSKMTLHKL